jgi:hypothetical protein
MIHPAVFGGESSDKNSRSSQDKTFVMRQVQPEVGRSVLVRQVFSHFQNLNLRVLIEDLRKTQVTRSNWLFADELCPVAHGMPSGRAVGVLRYLSQAVDLPSACRQAAEELGMPPRFVERFVLSWDNGTMSHDWLREQLETIWAERQADADAVQLVIDRAAQPLGLDVAEVNAPFA